MTYYWGFTSNKQPREGTCVFLENIIYSPIYAVITIFFFKPTLQLNQITQYFNCVVFFSNSSLLSTGRSKVDLNKYLISLRIVHLWWGVKWHNANLSNNRNGILNIQSTVSLKCKLPWSCPEQTSGEEGDMTVCTTPQTPPTHTHTLSFSPYTHMLPYHKE